MQNTNVFLNDSSTHAFHKTKLRTATLKFINQSRQAFTHTITLTLKPTIMVSTVCGNTFTKLTSELASKTLRHALNRINRHYFGNGFKRKPDTYALYVIAALENMDKHNPHFHLQIGNMPTSDRDEIYKVFNDCWQQTDFGNQHIHVDRLRDEGWASYITKNIRTGNTDCLDWSNTRLPNLPIAD